MRRCAPAWRNMFNPCADEQRDGIPALFDADAFGEHRHEAVRVSSAGEAAASDAILHVFYAHAFIGALRQMEHAQAVQGDHGFFGIVIQILADDQDCFAVAVTVRVGIFDIRRQRNIAGHFFPEITKLIARVPDVVSSGIDCVLFCARIVTGAARKLWTTDIRLAVEDADRRIEILAGLVKIRRWRDLDMCRRTGLRPCWSSRCRRVGRGWSLSMQAYSRP